MVTLYLDWWKGVQWILLSVELVEGWCSYKWSFFFGSIVDENCPYCSFWENLWAEWDLALMSLMDFNIVSIGLASSPTSVALIISSRAQNNYLQIPQSGEIVATSFPLGLMRGRWYLDFLKFHWKKLRSSCCVLWSLLAFWALNFSSWDSSLLGKSLSRKTKTEDNSMIAMD